MPTEPQILLDWTPAPQIMQWGAGMMEAIIELGQGGSTVTLYAHEDDLSKVPAALAASIR